MSMVIAETCINRGNCPNQAIAARDNVYVIRQSAVSSRRPKDCAGPCDFTIAVPPEYSEGHFGKRVGAMGDRPSRRHGDVERGGRARGPPLRHAGKHGERPRGAPDPESRSRHSYFFVFSKRGRYWP